METLKRRGFSIRRQFVILFLAMDRAMEMQELLKLNREGLIPGPGESEADFLERVQMIREKHTNQDAIPPHHWQWAQERLLSLFDFSPKWCTAISSSKGLTPWQAAATWIDVNRFYTIQINPAPWVQKLIDRDELLAHEAVHAARAAFDEPVHEEIFAYLTSNAKWRRVLGAFFRKPGDVLLLLGIISCGSLFQVLELFWNLPPLSSLFFLAGAFLALFWSARLLRAKLLLNRAAIHLKPFLREPSDFLAVLFRLTDEEVRQLAAGKKIIGIDLRWRLLKVAYLRDDLDFTTFGAPISE